MKQTNLYTAINASKETIDLYEGVERIKLKVSEVANTVKEEEGLSKKEMAEKVNLEDKKFQAILEGGNDSFTDICLYLRRLGYEFEIKKRK